ncbi:MAG: lipoyl(octanoyl) transferase LipB [Rhodocyclaceae bacterium]|jgi:lipoyl(octanoyl) transferase|nr:lipoyl(octanoyl) transferase LipB [Rhodocyclaceae bacterium]MCA3021268.1 lipoyl(octanoyl) transferase LipB [Rhodocyclaceae bacterium]MCA3026093.1 lipoyl(octanoyl) transferase LipB [Rhodocyclaceae bacterium]MCA3031481.1 lipoyl(octanoyl) transferase LipB [Rhodocyclaceae bacterium]MCA3036550.1 lipoyl(octanoyl) transferase LipB [Rhodocyclaceae bacterium]
MVDKSSLTVPLIKHLSLADYQQTFDAMRAHNRATTNETADEIWLLEHPPVFTQGLAGKAEHILDAGDVPVVKIDRGGQVTYHGPGQLVVYLLLNMRRRSYGVKSLVSRIEQSVIDLLAEYGIAALRQPGMPGVYVETSAGIAKIAAIGLRVANRATYHGLSLNIDMDLAPFLRINPCGYAGLAATQMSALGARDKMAVVGEKLLKHLKANLYG